MNEGEFLKLGLDIPPNAARRRIPTAHSDEVLVSL
jgi:hypothetical protein